MKQVFHQQTEACNGRREVEAFLQRSFYQRLLERFLADDESLADADYRTLYYGFSTAGEYDPWSDQQRKEIADSIRGKEYNNAIRQCDKVLEQIPVSLFANRCKGQLLSWPGNNTSESTRYLRRAEKLTNAILSEGDGRSCQSAFRVLFAIDEYEILYSHFGLKNYRSQYCGSLGDRFCIEPNDRYPAAEIYFRVLDPQYHTVRN